MPKFDEGLSWRASAGCGNGACIEVASGDNGVTYVRDSKDPDSPWLRFSHDDWGAFLDALRAGGLSDA